MLRFVYQAKLYEVSIKNLLSAKANDWLPPEFDYDIDSITVDGKVVSESSITDDLEQVISTLVYDHYIMGCV